MINVVFHPLAERELIEAARFYEARAVGLGGDLIREVEHALAQIIANPEAGSVLAGRQRPCRNDSAPARPMFPSFAISYQTGAENISVIALLHLHRRPGNWKRRVRDIQTGS